MRTLSHMLEAADIVEARREGTKLLEYFARRLDPLALAASRLDLIAREHGVDVEYLEDVEDDEW